MPVQSDICKTDGGWAVNGTLALPLSVYLHIKIVYCLPGQIRGRLGGDPRMSSPCGFVKWP